MYKVRAKSIKFKVTAQELLTERIRGEQTLQKKVTAQELLTERLLFTDRL